MALALKTTSLIHKAKYIFAKTGDRGVVGTHIRRCSRTHAAFIPVAGIASATPPSPSIAMLASSLSTAAREKLSYLHHAAVAERRERRRKGGKREEGRGGRYVDAISNTEAVAPSNKFGMQGPLVVYSHARTPDCEFLQDVDQTGNITPFDK